MDNYRVYANLEAAGADSAHMAVFLSVYKDNEFLTSIEETSKIEEFAKAVKDPNLNRMLKIVDLYNKQTELLGGDEGYIIDVDLVESFFHEVPSNTETLMNKFKIPSSIVNEISKINIDIGLLRKITVLENYTLPDFDESAIKILV